MTVQLTNLDFAVFAAYLVAVLGVGVWAARLARRTKRDYFLAGDKLPWWMIGASIVASNISSHQLIGLMGAAYACGFVNVINDWAAILVGLNALLWIFLPFYLRNGFYTMPEFLQRRFGNGARLAYSVLILFTYVFVEISGVLYLGGLALNSLLGIPILSSVIVLGVLTAAYTVTGGLRAVIWTEMMQLVVLLGGAAVLSVATFRAVGGWPAVVESTADWHLLLPASDPNYPWTMYLGSVLCVSTFYWAGNQFIVQRVLASRNEWDARMGVVFADYLKFLMPLLIVAPGMLAVRLYPNLERPDLVFPTLVQGLLPNGLVGLVMAGLIAAVMSHVSGAINSSATIATVDLYLPFLRPAASEQEAVRFGRWAGVVVALLGMAWADLMIAQSHRPIFLFLMDAYGYFAPGVGTMFLLGIFWKRTTQAGAVTAGVLSIPLSVALQLGWRGISFANRTGLVFWACLGLCAAISLVTRPKTDDELSGLIWSRESLRLPPDQRSRSRGLRSPVLWWALITVVVLYFYVRFP
jgi:SSS family solute:Na+ symporter